jgi:hypothetical protein
MMYPRLFVARQLLRDDGTIFISIDDTEVHNLRIIMNELFGEENFLATVIWEKVFAPKPAAKTFSTSHDYVLVYSKNSDLWERRLLPRPEIQDQRYSNPDNDPRGPWASENLLRNEHRDNSVYSLSSTVEALPEVKGNQVFRVTDPDREQSFCICLDDRLHDKTPEALTLGKEDLFVCRDAALTDEQAANMALQSKIKTI